ncbi:MAG TPA: DegT/DnrJ/EryC1/StrS family aminotransferase, partial [Polyangiales bacterium]
LGPAEAAAAARVLASGMLVQGPEVAAFEAALGRETGRAQVVAVCNGTAALELSLRALGIGPGDAVVCPALTWPSPAHAVHAVGAQLVLADVDPHEWNMTGATLAPALEPRVKAVIAIEQFGNPARHDELSPLLGAISLVVDAACSLGSRYRGAPCGSHGSIACTSFHPRKVITTGEGGACLTDDPALAARLRALRNHGQSAPGKFECASGNYRMTELAAAVGRVQLEKLSFICEARRRHAARIIAALAADKSGVALSFQHAPREGQENRQTLGLLVGTPGEGTGRRDRFISELQARGVQAGKLSYALHALPQFAREAAELRAAGRGLPVSEDIAARGLCVPLFPSMSEEQVDQVIDALRAVRGLL